MQLGRDPADAAARQNDRPNQGQPRAQRRRNFCSTFDTSMKYLKLDHVDLLVAARHQQPRTARLRRCRRTAASPRRASSRRRAACRFIGFSTHATTDIILDAIEQRRIRLRQPALVFRQRPELAGHRGGAARGTWACSSSARTTRAANSTNRRAKLVELCAPLTPMQFNDLYCLARPEVHTLSCGAARPADFDEHVAALEYYDRIPETIAPIEKRLARGDGARARRGLVRALVRRACRNTSTCPARSTCSEILRLWTYAQVARPGRRGARCATTCSARPTIGSPAKTPAKCAELNLRRRAETQPVRRAHSGHSARSAPMLFEKPVKRLSES